MLGLATQGLWMWEEGMEWLPGLTVDAAAAARCCVWHWHSH